MLEKLKQLTGDENSSYHDLDLINSFYAKIEHSILKSSNKTGGIPVYDKL
jgi:hypothetical protein